MTIVLCDRGKCEFNRNGICQAETIYIVDYRYAADCTQFVRHWLQIAREASSNEARSSQAQS